MNYLPFALLSYLLNSLSVTVDKFLLTKTIPDPLIYIFYFSLLSLLFIFAIPFTHFPGNEVFILSSVSTLTWTLGTYFMFIALKIGQVQRVIPIIGTITPLILLIFASQTKTITFEQTIAVCLLVLGLIFLTIKDWKGRFLKKELFLELASGSLFAISYFLLREAFLKDDFFTVFIWSKPVLIPLGILFLIIPSLRRKIQPALHPKASIQKGAPLFLFGQISGGISEILLTFSISLANPAIVNSIQGVKYVYLFIGSLILGKKYPQVFQARLSGSFLISQILGIGLIGIGLYLLTS